MNLDVLIPTTVGVLLLAVGAHNELQWRRRLWNHVALTGRVVGLHSDGDGGCFPEIEFEFAGRKKKFRSAYSIGPTPFVGDSVKIIAEPDGENAEYFTNKSRWYFTAIPVVTGLACIAIALF